MYVPFLWPGTPGSTFEELNEGNNPGNKLRTNMAQYEVQFCKLLLRHLNIIIVFGGGLERPMQRRISACLFSCNLLSLAKSVTHGFITMSCCPFIGTTLMPGQIFNTEKSETWCWP